MKLDLVAIIMTNADLLKVVPCKSSWTIYVFGNCI